MENLSVYFGHKLELIQPSVWKTYFELRSDDEIIGTMKKIKTLGSQMEVSLFNKTWTIYPPSIWRSEIDIKESGKALPFAKYKKERFKSRGIVELPKGARLKIVFKAFKKGYEVQDSSGQVLVKLVDKMKLRTTVEIFIEKRSEMIDKYPWIIMLAWYISEQSKHIAVVAA